VPSAIGFFLTAASLSRWHPLSEYEQQGKRMQSLFLRDVLEVETRGMKGPRVMDSTGLPLHNDNQTIVKERIYLDEKNPNVLYDEITTIDHAFTRPGQ
jgi:hypothetical protein